MRMKAIQQELAEMDAGGNKINEGFGIARLRVGSASHGYCTGNTVSPAQTGGQVRCRRLSHDE